MDVIDCFKDTRETIEYAVLQADEDDRALEEDLACFNDEESDDDNGQEY